jgi:hypothetical protein
MKRLTAIAGMAFSLLYAQSATAQVTLLTVDVAPPTPTITDNIIASAGGMVNVSDIPTFRTEWKRDANDILMDVLHDFVGAGAPPQMLPYTQQAVVGNLPTGTYNLTARLFSSFRAFPGPTYAEPWTFPPADSRIVATRSTTFTVVPEPSSFALAMAGGLLLLRRHRPNGSYYWWPQRLPQHR